MIKYKNLYLLGTSHISKDSVKAVEKSILKIKPKIIALELDRRRFNLINTQNRRRFSLSDVRNFGIKAFLLNFIGAWFEKKMSKKVGTKPGGEMKKAIELAEKNKIKIELIDQDIQYTINRLMRLITRREKIRFIKDLIFGGEADSFNIKKVPDKKDITKIINKIKQDYPSFYLTVIKERNEFMAKGLYSLMNKFPIGRILGIIGAGHEKAIVGEIKLLEKK
ncbi:TraB/GumN family protein [Candidatus Woesearchaeota archaeon]|nr:TraB/GumN family protein [Candidatus Woesearchaeota archaeon]